MRNDKVVYIRRSDLLRALDSEQENSIGPEDTYAGGLAAAIEIVEECVGIETIKLEPPRRGEWFVGGINPVTGAAGNWKCSLCRGTSLKDSDFCPNCGADMRGKDHEHLG